MKTTNSDATEPSRLCYLDATQLEGPLEDFEGIEIRNRNDGKIGRLDGVVIDPAEGRVCYLVVDNERVLRHQRYLLPLDAAQVDIEHRALCVDADDADLRECEEFDQDRYHSFSFRPRERWSAAARIQ
jgi:sporulation protein YlmC with PRC-barrel domain